MIKIYCCIGVLILSFSKFLNWSWKWEKFATTKPNLFLRQTTKQFVHAGTFASFGFVSPCSLSLGCLSVADSLVPTDSERGGKLSEDGKMWLDQCAVKKIWELMCGDLPLADNIIDFPTIRFFTCGLLSLAHIRKDWKFVFKCNKRKKCKLKSFFYDAYIHINARCGNEIAEHRQPHRRWSIATWKPMGKLDCFRTVRLFNKQLCSTVPRISHFIAIGLIGGGGITDWDILQSTRTIYFRCFRLCIRLPS